MRPDGGRLCKQSHYINLASLSTLARPGAEFRRRQALAFLEAMGCPSSACAEGEYQGSMTMSGTQVVHEHRSPRSRQKRLVLAMHHTLMGWRAHQKTMMIKTNTSDGLDQNASFQLCASSMGHLAMLTEYPREDGDGKSGIRVLTCGSHDQILNMIIDLTTSELPNRVRTLEIPCTRLNVCLLYRPGVCFRWGKEREGVLSGVPCLGRHVGNLTCT